MKILFFKTTAVVICFFSMFNSIAQQWGNHTLYATQNGTTAVIIDTAGITTHTWTFSSTAKTGYSSYLLQGGILLRTVSRAGNSFTGGPICGEFQKIDWNGNVLWDYVYSTTAYCSHHDICPLPNGNVLLIAYETKTGTEVTAAGGTSAITMWPEKIVEIKQTGATSGTVVWEWKLWDHLVQNVDPTKANYQTSIVNHPELYNINYSLTKDFMHMNGLDYNPILDQVTFSSHYLNQLFVIDHSTTTAEAASHIGGHSGKGGDFLYRYGNPASYGATGATVLNVVHDSHWIPEGVPNAGYLVGFVNNGISVNQSSVDQVVTPLSGYNYTITPGSAYSPSNYTLRHACNGHTSNQGNSQQLPNGNMLVCMAFVGSIYEVNPVGTTIWSKSGLGTLVHAYRYDDCYINNAAPAQHTISETAGTLTTASATTYQWYLNGVEISGATNQSYTPMQSGIYLVRTTDVNGCAFYYSHDYTFSLTTGINNYANEFNLNLYPNPTTGIIDIDLNYRNPKKLSVFLLNALGNVVFESENNSRIDLTQLANGLYTMSIILDSNKPVYKKIVLTK